MLLNMEGGILAIKLNWISEVSAGSIKKWVLGAEVLEVKYL
jgi:hypothetical protein